MSLLSIQRGEGQCWLSTAKCCLVGLVILAPVRCQGLGTSTVTSLLYFQTVKGYGSLPRHAAVSPSTLGSLNHLNPFKSSVSCPVGARHKARHAPGCGWTLPVGPALSGGSQTPALAQCAMHSPFWWRLSPPLSVYLLLVITAGLTHTSSDLLIHVDKQKAAQASAA